MLVFWSFHIALIWLNLFFWTGLY